MIRQSSVKAGRRIRAAACAGGMARHYRVQLFNLRDHRWQMYGTYRRRDLAEKSLARLAQAGHRVRLVDFAICPPAY